MNLNFDCQESPSQNKLTITIGHVDCWPYVLTPNTPLIQTFFTYSKLNMEDFSALTSLLGYLDCTHKVELKSLHAQTR